jgi:hypothetical protein
MHEIKQLLPIRQPANGSEQDRVAAVASHEGDLVRRRGVDRSVESHTHCTWQIRDLERLERCLAYVLGDPPLESARTPRRVELQHLLDQGVGVRRGSAEQPHPVPSLPKPVLREGPLPGERVLRVPVPIGDERNVLGVVRVQHPIRTRSKDQGLGQGSACRREADDVSFLEDRLGLLARIGRAERLADPPRGGRHDQWYERYRHHDDET